MKGNKGFIESFCSLEKKKSNKQANKNQQQTKTNNTAHKQWIQNS